jgi:MFS family permease
MLTSDDADRQDKRLLDARLNHCPFASACESMPGRCVVPLVATLVFLSSLPDAMVAPLLRDLLVDRYGVSESAAHAFMIVNILGGLAAVPWLRRRAAHVRPNRMIAVAAAMNGLLLLCMALPIGFGATIAVRIAEGAADLIVFAGLFELLRRSTQSNRCATRMGLGGTMLMLGLATGMALSGPLAAAGEGAAFAMGGAACMVAAVLATRLLGVSNDAVRTVSPCDSTAGLPSSCGLNRVPLWSTMVMAGTDRALGAILAVSVPMYLAHAGSISRGLVGPMIAMAMLLMSIGAWAGGALADRFGPRRSRAVATAAYGAAFASLPTTISSPGAFVAAMTVIGLSGAVLLPTMLTMAACSGRGAAAMGASQSAGSIGFALGIGFAAGVLQLVSTDTAASASYSLMIQAAGLVYLLLNGLAIHAAWPRVRAATSSSAPTLDIGNQSLTRVAQDVAAT